MYRFITEEAQLTLHEARLTDVSIGANLIWRFADGFDVYADHSLNPTGRHKNTGPAEVEMVNARLLNAVLAYAPAGYQVSFDNFREDVEILSFDVDPIAGVVKTYCQLNTSSSLIEYHIACDRVYYKWNDLLEDAWFQDWPPSKG